MNRQEDLTKIFDKTWKANHNDTAKRGRERERVFINKMFNVKEENKIAPPRVETPGERANNLNKRIEGTVSFQRKNMVNNIIKKWK